MIINVREIRPWRAFAEKSRENFSYFLGERMFRRAVGIICAGMSQLWSMNILSKCAVIKCTLRGLMHAIKAEGIAAKRNIKFHCREMLAFCISSCSIIITREEAWIDDRNYCYWHRVATGDVSKCMKSVHTISKYIDMHASHKAACRNRPSLVKTSNNEICIRNLEGSFKYLRKKTSGSNDPAPRNNHCRKSMKVYQA